MLLSHNFNDPSKDQNFIECGICKQLFDITTKELFDLARNGNCSGAPKNREVIEIFSIGGKSQGILAR